MPRKQIFEHGRSERALGLMGEHTQSSMTNQSAVAIQMLRAALREADFLKDVPSKLLKKLATSIPIRSFEAGHVLMRQGEYGHTVFILLDGTLELSVQTEAGETLVLSTPSKAGSYVGEKSLLGRSRREATVRSSTQVLVAELEKTVVERLDLVCDGTIFPILQQNSHIHSIETFLRSHRFLAAVSDDWIRRIAQESKIETFERGKTLFKPGDRGTCVHILKAGVAKLQRENTKDASVLAYFNVGDLAGTASGAQTASLIAMGHVETVALPRVLFEEFARQYPNVVEKFKKEERSPAAASATIAGFVEDFLGEGAQEGLSLLTINLDKCIRCGNCVRACESRHGHARFTRRGKTLVRRKKMQEAGKHETLLIPSSCRHCVNPECMVGCPTGAIHRRPGGEVDIEPFCIGCGSCATRCPYDNITMVPTPGRLVDDVERDMLANKCNLCAGYDGPNCVNNCPTGAILRIEPTAYFEELTEVIGQTGQVAVGQTQRGRSVDVGRWLIPLIALVAAIGLGVWSLTETEMYSPWSTKGMTLGGLGFGFMVGALALGIRRRISGLNTQFGRFLTWTRVHIYVGLLAMVSVLLHSRGNGGGAITTAVLAITAFEVLTGFFGLFLYRWLPKVLTRIEGDAQVEEDVRSELAKTDTAISELAQGLGAQGHTVLKLLRPMVPSRLQFASKTYETKRAKQTIVSEAKPLAAASPEFEPLITQLALLHLRRGELTACLSFYGVRKGWLLSHIGISALLISLVVVHIIAVFYFWGGAGA